MSENLVLWAAEKALEDANLALVEATNEFLDAKSVEDMMIALEKVAREIKRLSVALDNLMRVKGRVGHLRS